MRNVPEEAKVELLRMLGYDSDGTWVLDSAGARVLDRYSKQPVRLNHMIIMPGSTIILEDSDLSVAQYFEEFGDKGFDVAGAA